MVPPTPRGRDRTSDLLVDIMTLLESRGLAGDSYQLYESIDIEALAELIDSAAGDTEIRFSVEGVDLVATQNGVGLARDDSAGTR